MKKLLSSLILTFIIFNTFAQNQFYWVNGTGVWNDKMHWSLTSGGVPGADIPSKSDNVIFDNNSLLNTGDVILINEDVSVNNFITNASFILKGKKNITVYGNIEINEKTSLNKFKGDIILASSKHQKINIPVNIKSDIIFKGTGLFDITSELNTRKNIYLDKGYVYTNNNNIECNSFIANSSDQIGLDLGNSEITVNYWDFSQAENINFKGEKSTIIIPKSVDKNFSTSNSIVYNRIIPKGASKAIDATLTPKDATCSVNSDTGTKDDGEIKVDVTGGSGSYLIRLYDGGMNLLAEKSGVASYTFTSSDISNGDLTSGTYNIAYGEDANSLQTKSTTVGPANLNAEISVASHITCPNGDDLSLTVTTSGGWSTITSYQWTAQTDAVFSFSGQTTNADLDMDNYKVVVTDNNSCSFDTNFYYYPIGHPNNNYLVADGRPDNFSVSNITTVASCEGSSNGSITVGTVTGGTPSGGQYYYAAVVNGSGNVPVYGALGANTISNLAAGDYDIWIKDGAGCEYKHNTVITVDETPKPTVSTIADDDVCEGDNYTFSGVTASNYSSLNWTSADGNGTWNDNTILNPIFTPDAAHITAGSIDLTITVNGNGNCAAVFETMTLSINSKPTVSLTDKNICENIDLNLDGNPSGGTTPYVTHKWTGTGAGYLDATNTQTPTFNSSTNGNYTLTYTVTDSKHCSASDNMTVTVEDGPSVNAGPDDEICENNTYTVSQASVTNGTVLWTENGAGSISDATTITPTYHPAGGETGNVTITVKATGTGACNVVEVVDDMILKINPKPVPTITGPNKTCLNTTKTYTTEAGMSGYTWSVNDGTILSGNGTNSVQVKWTGTAAPSVSVTYTNGNGCSAGSPTVLAVTVHNLPDPDLSINNDEVCQNTNLSLDGNPQGGSGTYISHLWSNTGVGYLDATNIQTPTFNCNAPGTYSLTYTVTDNNGCEGSDNMSITVKEGPTANAGPDDESCEGDAYTVPNGNASGTNGNPGWSTTGTGTITNANTYTPTYTPNAGETGNIILTLTVTTPTGVCAGIYAEDQMTLTIHPQPVPTITGDNEACLNTSKTYNTETGMTDYTWTVNDGNITSGAGTNTITVLWTGTTSPSVSVNYKNGNSCSAATPTTLNVTVYDNPTVDLSVNTNTVCENNNLNLDGNPSGGATPYTHLWSGAGAAYLDATDTQTPTFNCNTPNSYDITYTVTDAHSCTASDNMTITVTQGPDAYAGKDTTVCYEAVNYQISDATATNYSAISWKNSTTGDGTGFDDNTKLNPVYTPSDADRVAGSVTLTMTVASATCSSVSDEMVLSFSPELNVSVGGLSPYLIDVNTTEINVSFWATHPDISQLSFYLVAPDGTTQIKLYSYNSGTDGCNPWDITTTSIDSLVFSLNSSGNQGAFNLCNFAGSSDPITGEFNPAESWNAFDGLDPAEGGWSLKIKDNFTGSEGKLKRARITFSDINHNGDLQQITFDSKDIDYAINDNDSTIYTVPIGLRTSCNGACDARAVVAVTGGTPPYVSYVWDTGQKGDTVDLCGGDHTVTVTDSKGCLSSGKVSVLEPDPIIIAFDSTNVKCFGDTTGMVKVIASGGTGAPYNYLWDDKNNSTTAQVNNLPAGTYTVTVTDNNKCNKIGSVTITQPATAVTVSKIVIDSTNCNASDGTITITTEGGTPFIVGNPYNYFWVYDGSTDNPKTGLAVGNYTVNISDSVGCNIDTTITMVDKGTLEITGFTMVTPVSCNSSCDGAVRVDFTGGSGNYTFNWSGGGLSGTDDTLPNVCGDTTYTVLITDAATTCSTTDQYKIPQPDTLKVKVLNISDALCYGKDNGSAEVEGEGGTPPYSYVWTNAGNDTLSTSAKADNLFYGYNYINITDAYGCSVDDSVFIDQPIELTVSKDSTTTNCGTSEGTAVVTPSGGTPPYIYLWDDGNATTDSIVKNLSVGIYHVTVTDFGNCQIVESVTIVDTSSMEVTVDEITNVSCNGDSNGAIDISVKNATNPYDFVWSNGETTEDITGLIAGTYKVTVTDANMCSRVANVEVTQPDILKITHNVINEPKCAGDENGSAAVTPTGGTQPYTYAWADGQTDSLAVNLAAGQYVVTVTDKNKCSATDTIIITEPQYITFDFEYIPTNCGESVGQLWVKNISGGTGAGTYTTSWASPLWASYPVADSINTDTIRNLKVANYVAIVTDANNCFTRDSIYMRDTSDISLVLDSIADVLCNGANNGAVLVHGINGEKPYSYLWGNGDTDSLLNDVTAGIYRLSVLDNRLCQRDTAFIITEPDEITNKWVFTDSIVCAGKDSASFYAQIRGGVAPYDYLWTNSNNEQISTDSGLVHVKPDWYYLKVIDKNKCEFTDSIHIVSPNPIVLTITQGETNCPEDSSGWASVTVAGGIAPYSYYWFLRENPQKPLNGQTTNNVTDLWVDVYVLQVTDKLGCTVYDTIIIQNDSDLAFNYKIDHHVWCPDLCDAKAHITLVTNPNPITNYTTYWSDGFVGDTNANLCIGEHTVIVQENVNGCRRIDTITIDSRDMLKYQLTTVDNGYTTAPNGLAMIRPTGGDTANIEKYYIDWMDADMAIQKQDTLKVIDGFASWTGLKEGKYYVALRNNRQDGQTCELLDSFTIKLDTLSYDTIQLVNVRCYGDSTGIIEVKAHGGSHYGYTYKWRNSAWDADSISTRITNLWAGIYNLTITDDGNNEIHASIEVTQPNEYRFKFAADSDIANPKPGCTDSTGVIKIITDNQGGTPPYSYKWYNKGNLIGDTTVMKELWVDYYTITSTDSLKCKTDTTFFLEDNTDFDIDVSATMPIPKICYGDNTGSAKVVTAQGIAPFEYTWFEQNNYNDTISTQDTITDKYVGWYIIRVTDNNNCIRLDSVEIEQFDSMTFALKDTIFNDCYNDTLGGFTFTNVKGGTDSGTGYKFRLLNASDNSLVKFQPELVFEHIGAGRYYLNVESEYQCRSSKVPFDFYSKSPQIIGSFTIIDSATCNEYSDDGKLAIKINYGYFDEIIEDAKDSIAFTEYIWNSNPMYSDKTLTEAFAGLNKVQVTSKTKTDAINCKVVFDTIVPAKTTVLIDSIYFTRTGLIKDYFCPADTVSIYAMTLETGADSLIWVNNSSIIGALNTNQIDVVSDTSQKYFAEARIYYTNNLYCHVIDSISVGRYTVDSLTVATDAKNNKIFVGNEVALSAEKPNASYPEDDNLSLVHKFTWGATTSGNVVWNPTPPDSNKVTAKPNMNTRFTVYDTLYINNIKYSNQKCILFDTVFVTVLPKFEPPKGFTPNADGSNDEWRLPGIDGYDDVSVQIYDRWGGLVWEHKGEYDGNKWKGENLNGKALPSGTYYYIIKYGDSDSGTKTLTGSVAIIR
jgi:gliding motility-associated-like protein